jgi:hypothetical protein
MTFTRVSLAATVGGLISLSTAAMAGDYPQRPDLEGIEHYLPSYISPVAFKKEASSEILTRVTSDVDKTNCDFGFTFPYILPPLRWAMEEIQSRYEESGMRPLVFDAGAGAGFATWKMIAVGGKVIPLELSKETAKDLMISLKKLRGFLQEGEHIKDTCPRVLTGSVMNFNSPAYTYNYDGAYIGNLLHFLTPDEANSFVTKLFEVINPGGFVAAVVNTPSASESIVDTWRQSHERGNPYPGYLVQNNHIYRRDYGRGVQQNVAIRIEEARAVQEGDLLPGRVRKGTFAEPNQDDKPNWSFVNKGVDGFGSFLEFSRYEHRTTHYMDPMTLRTLFERAGFTTKQVYYLDTYMRQLGPENVTDDMLKKGQFNLGIEVMKPE